MPRASLLPPLHIQSQMTDLELIIERHPLPVSKRAQRLHWKIAYA